jgi:hypothetical protein
MDIKDTYTKTFLKAANADASNEDVIQHKKLWWYSFRSKDNGGLRLTEEGLNFITNQAEIKTYKVDFPKDFSITPQVLVWLDNFIDSPYYITKRYMIVLKERAAFELYLFSGDIKKFGYAKALNRRLNQESSEE